MVFFGIDPGSNVTGYGVIQVNGNTIRWLDSGVISLPRATELNDRLVAIYDRLCEKLCEHKPDCVCVEEAFYAKNAKTALVLGQARGIAILAARKSGAVVTEFAPREIKKAVVGSGGASKEQVHFMIQTLLSPGAVHDKLDAYDALATALCGFYNNGAVAALKRKAK